MKPHILATLIFVLFQFLPTRVQAQEIWSVAFPLIPGLADQNNKGLYIDITKAIAKEAKVKLNIKVYPFARALHNVGSGKADMLIPIIEPEKGAKKHPGILSDFAVNYIDFKIYSLKKIDLTRLPDLDVETEASHTALFRQKYIKTYCLRCSLRKIKLGRLDALIHAYTAVENTMRKENITGIHRQFYRTFPARILFRPNAPKKLQNKVRKAFHAIVKNGEYGKVAGYLRSSRLIKEVKEISDTDGKL